MKRLRKRAWNRAAACTLTLTAFGIAVGAQVAAGNTIPFVSTDPEIEMWFYPFSTANGTGSVRDRGAVFSWYTPQAGFPNITGTGIDPIQRGTILVASDTSQEIPPQLDPARYRIDSLRVTLTMLGSIGSRFGAYDGTPDDYVAVGLGNDDDPGHPVEMWGVGFDGDYTTFGFAGESEPEYFNSGDRRWPISGGSFTGPYQLYAADAEGNDVSNAVLGGYSATAPNNTTDAFSPSPLAVGKVYDEVGQELVPGTLVGQGAEFVFELDLSNSAIVTYVQNSLAAGHLGFFFASLDEPNGHEGNVFYPDFYLDNNSGGPNPNGNAPMMEIAVTILDDWLAGDYDRSGTVDTLDYDAWKQAFGTSVEPGSGADGNGDGLVDAADYTVWRDHFVGGGAAAAANVPEPGAAWLVVTAATLGLSAAGRRKHR